MKNEVQKLIRKQSKLLAQPYGKARNAALWRVPSKLEKSGLFNSHGKLVTTQGSSFRRDFQILSARRVA